MVVVLEIGYWLIGVTGRCKGGASNLHVSEKIQQYLCHFESKMSFFGCSGAHSIHVSIVLLRLLHTGDR